MYKLDYTGKFKRDLKLCQKRGYDMTEMQKVIKHLENDGQVPAIYRPHKLTGKLRGYWECHVEPDWLLIYDIQDTIQLISLV